MRKVYRLTLKKWLHRALFMIVLPLIIAGCFPDDSHFNVTDDLEGRLFPQIQAEPRFSTYARGIEMTGLEEFIGRAGLYTVYVPTNEAWDEYFNQHPTYNSLDDIPDAELERLIAYHAMVEMKFSFDYEDGIERFFALGGKYLTVEKNAETGVVTVDGANFVPEVSDINAENGAIHGLNKVLVPKPNVAEFARARRNDNFSIYHDLLEKFTRREVNESLSTPDQIVIDTVSLLNLDFRNEDQLLTSFFFTDQAFNDWMATQPQFETIDDIPEAVLELIMNYHFIESDPDGNLPPMASDLYNTSVETTTEEMLTLKPEQVAEENVEISNGRAHVVSELLLPPSFETVAGYTLLNPDEDLLIFYRALDKAGLYDDLLDQSASFTVFAPNDDAFMAAGIDTTIIKSLSGGELDKIVRYHLLPSTVKSTDLTDGYVQNQQGSAILVNGTTLSDVEGDLANIIEVDIETVNGVIHKIDKVMTPPAGSLYEQLTNDPASRFSTLVEALDMVDKTELIQSGGHTIFAPTNQAFQDYFDTRPDVVGLINFQNKTAELDSIISNHVVTNTSIFTLEMTDGDEIETALGDTVTVVKSGQLVKLSDQNGASVDATIDEKDWQATDGVIHIIDKILLPK